LYSSRGQRPGRTISPHTTSCRYRPLYSLPVRKPSLPATSSRQSVDISCSIEPASCVCAGLMPNIIHLPIRDLTSESHRGLSAAVAGVSLLGDVDWYRAWHPARRSVVGVVRRSAERARSARISMVGSTKELRRCQRPECAMLSSSIAMGCVSQQLRDAERSRGPSLTVTSSYVRTVQASIMPSVQRCQQPTACEISTILILLQH